MPGSPPSQASMRTHASGIACWPNPPSSLSELRESFSPSDTNSRCQKRVDLCLATITSPSRSSPRATRPMELLDLFCRTSSGGRSLISRANTRRTLWVLLGSTGSHTGNTIDVPPTATGGAAGLSRRTKEAEPRALTRHATPPDLPRGAMWLASRGGPWGSRTRDTLASAVLYHFVPGLYRVKGAPCQASRARRLSMQRLIVREK